MGGTAEIQWQPLSGLLSVPAASFVASTPPSAALGDQQPRQEELLRVEEHVKHPDGVAGDVPIQRSQQFAAQRSNEARDLVHQGGGNGAPLVLDNVLDGEQELVDLPDVGAAPQLLIPPGGGGLEFAVNLLDCVA